jgi:hypothetical protein
VCWWRRLGWLGGLGSRGLLETQLRHHLDFEQPALCGRLARERRLLGLPCLPCLALALTLHVLLRLATLLGADDLEWLPTFG